MPKVSKKKTQKGKVEEPEQGDDQENIADERIMKTSIQISTKVRDRLWKLKFRKTYDEFLWELCEMYESGEKEE